MKRTSVLTAGFIAALVLGLSGCAWIDEVGKDKSQAEFRLTPASSEDTDDMFSCARSQFPVHPYHFETNAPKDSITTIGMYRSPTEKLRETSVFIQFVGVNADTLEDCPAPSTLVESDVDVGINGCVRASILFSSCDDKILLRVSGTLHVDEFSTERGGRMAGSLSGSLEYVEYVESSTDKIERRTNVGTVEGEYSFVNKAGDVWEHGRVPTN
ncbi:MAG: hypothetical protein IJU23_03550 [Proteobacteria bacterium]|nr:hypothetical protein [Pseudomonadota bacterium]